jgi:hypothetical protein
MTRMPNSEPCGAGWSVDCEVVATTPTWTSGTTPSTSSSDKANRAASLSRYLDSAVQLSDRNLYGPAFTILRSGLEHAAFDWLVFLGDTYVERMRSVSDETWEEWQRDRAAGAD